MTTATYAGRHVAVNDEGFFEHPEEWTEAMAPEIAEAEGIGPLTERHWQVIRFMRAEFRRRGQARRSACSAGPLASQSKSSTCCSRMGRLRPQRRSRGSPSPAAASDE